MWHFLTGVKPPPLKKAKLGKTDAVESKGKVKTQNQNKEFENNCGNDPTFIYHLVELEMYCNRMVVKFEYPIALSVCH